MKIIYKEKIGCKRIIHIGFIKIKYQKQPSIEDIENHIKKSMGKQISMFMQIFFDPKDIKCKGGKYKILNDGHKELLRIFSEICHKHNLKWWCEWGTLLGAVRHQDCIPWDDDCDVGMPRQDYEKFCEIIEKELQHTNIKVMGVSSIPVLGGPCIKLINKQGNKFLNLDIIPFDLYYEKLSQEGKQNLTQKLYKLQKFYRNLLPLDHGLDTREQVQDFYEKMKEATKQIALDGNEPNEKVKPCVFRRISISDDIILPIRDWEDMFPLRKQKFGKYEVFVPNKPEKILDMLYGNWEAFPPCFDLNAFEFTYNRLPSNITEIVDDLKQTHIK